MNMVSIVEIPVVDFGKAKNFYQEVFACPIEDVEMGDTLMGLFPGDGEGVNSPWSKVRGTNLATGEHWCILPPGLIF